jgi:hypothetical protein
MMACWARTIIALDVETPTILRLSAAVVPTA